MLTKKKKIIILTSMALLLVATGILNVILNKNVDTINSNSTTITTGNYFTTFKQDRTTTRNLELDVLNEIILSTGSSSEYKSTATQKKLEIVANMEKELILEGFIKAKGFEDVVVTVATNSITAIVKGKDNLTASETAKILNVITTETGCKATSVKIIPIQ